MLTAPIKPDGEALGAGDAACVLATTKLGNFNVSGQQNFGAVASHPTRFAGCLSRRFAFLVLNEMGFIEQGVLSRGKWARRSALRT